MPLDETWWDPLGPFADNSVGGITASTMRDFAKAISDYGSTGSWFNIMFEVLAITPEDWAVVDGIQVLWLKKTPEFSHSEDWTYTADGELRDCFTYLPSNLITVRVTFSPSTVNVTNATPGTEVTPVVSLTPDALVEPEVENTFAVGPTHVLSTSDQNIDIGGWAVAMLADTERCVRFGLRFDPPAGESIADHDGGGAVLDFDVDATGVGAAVVANPLAPSA